MTKYTIEQTDTGAAIELTGVEGREEELLQAFAECQAGQCSCPTDEHEKVDAMEVSPSDDQIQIRLRAKPGTTFDPTEIASCLDYTVAEKRQ